MWLSKPGLILCEAFCGNFCANGMRVGSVGKVREVLLRADDIHTHTTQTQFRPTAMVVAGVKPRERQRKNDSIRRTSHAFVNFFLTAAEASVVVIGTTEDIDISFSSHARMRQVRHATSFW